MLLKYNPFDIICIQEHWLQQEKLLSFSLIGYKLVSSFCRAGNNEHGGVAVFGLSSLHLKPLDLKVFSVPYHAEFCGVHIVDSKCALISLYRSSSSGDIGIFRDKTFHMLNHLSQAFRHIMLIGDINLDLDGHTSMIWDINNVFAMFNLKHYIHEPTRVTSSSSSNLDNIVTNLSCKEVSVGVWDPHISDHYAIYAVLQNIQGRKISTSNKVMVRAVNEKRIINFAKYLSSICWGNMESLTATEMSNWLLNYLRTQVDKYFPYVRARNGHRNFHFKWFNQRLREMRKNLFMLKHHFNITKLDCDWDNYKQLRNKYKRALKEEKRDAYTREILRSNCKSKTIWKLVNSETKPNADIVSTSLSPDDFNQFFSVVCESISERIDKDNLDPMQFLRRAPNSVTSFFMTTIVESDVREVILALKNSSALDYYGLSSYMIKASLESLVGPLTCLFNKCLEEGNWPDPLKISKVTPIYKGGDSDCLDNFRPISIIPLLGKILEVLIRDKLVAYCEKYSLFSNCQFGFRKKRSTVKALLKLIEDVVEGLDEGVHTNAIMCDLTKAFDCVRPSILMRKLEYYGIRGNVLRLFSSYLSGRRQFVAYQGVESCILPIENGVPQGSVLGPFLFLLYVNDLPDSLVESSCILYADDTTLLTRGGHGLSDIQIAKNWFSANNLKLNESKTQNILFSSDKWVTQSEPVKLLGVILDTSLTWNHHIAAVCSRVSSSIFALRQLAFYLSGEVLRTVYFSTVQSHISYNILLWGNSTNACKVFWLQKSAIRVIARAPPLTPCKELFKKLNILPLPCLYILETIMFIKQNCQNYKKHSELHDHKTRQAGNLVPPFSRIRITQKNKVDITLFNKFTSLHKNVTVMNMPSSQFRKFVKSFLLTCCFYSVDEFLSFRV